MTSDDEENVSEDPSCVLVHQSTFARRIRGYPFERRYAALQGDDEHPVDTVIDRIPNIATVDRKVVDLSRRWPNEVRDAEGYRNYEDFRVKQRVLREEAFFDAGHREGFLGGVLSKSLNASANLNSDSRAFARKIQIARIGSKLPAEQSVAVAAFEITRALVLGRPLLRARKRQ